ncbi:Wzz/FepE/Etk N-terminal domain-containing protein [Reichenbachiella sp.]|uniref:Wzz/FepE/Etk N-terminal domain-containing protein n=1 Tax=Reichenbachiella sp. TaxID=2184521 RepID=UPI003BB02BBD
MQNTTKNHDDEIDLLEIVNTLWNGRVFIAKITGYFAIIGVIIAILSPVEYESSCKLLPESQETQIPNLGGLAGLAGLAGVDLSAMNSSAAGVLTPQLYPEIVRSLPFILEVINDTIYLEKKNLHTTPFHYFKEIQRPSALGYVKKYTLGIPGLIRGAFNNEELTTANNSPFYRISREDWSIIEAFKERITIENDPETGIILVEVEMPDPFAAAQIAKKIEIMITDAVISYKTDKADKNLNFILETYDEAKRNFENIQLKLARATDRNKNVTSATAQIELKKIEHEYDIAFDVFKGLSSQVEQAKIQLKEETPVFTVLEPVRIPDSKSKPRRTLIVILFCIVGSIFATLYHLIRTILLA